MKSHVNRFRLLVHSLHATYGIEYVVVSRAPTGTFQLYMCSSRPSEICHIDLLLKTFADKPGVVHIHPQIVRSISPGAMPLSDLSSVLLSLDRERYFNLTQDEYCGVLREYAIPVRFSR